MRSGPPPLAVLPWARENRASPQQATVAGSFTANLERPLPCPPAEVAGRSAPTGESQGGAKMTHVVLAAKITHVPSIWMDLTMEKYRGLRAQAIKGLTEIGRRAHARGAETFLVFDTHWIVNQGFHVNAKRRHEGVFTSGEMPHMLADLKYAYDGDPELARAIAGRVAAAGFRAVAHDNASLGCEYGTLLPMHLMNAAADIAVLPVAANQFASIDEGRRMGAAMAEAIEATGRKVAVLASGSLSHQFWPNAHSAERIDEINTEFNRQVDLRVLELWRTGRVREFLDMLPEYAVRCHGECAMIDTAMLFGVLGWHAYKGRGEVVGEYFPSSGTGQAVVDFGLAA
jgi:3,4-dihydroxyphenylacetate 2,3-dioxygenase